MQACDWDRYHDNLYRDTKNIEIEPSSNTYEEMKWVIWKI